MDINELNKMSIVAQFSKLISQPNIKGSETGNFAGFLADNGAHDIKEPSTDYSLKNSNVSQDKKESVKDNNEVEQKQNSQKDTVKDKAEQTQDKNQNNSDKVEDKNQDKSENKESETVEKTVETSSESNKSEKTNKKQKTEDSAVAATMETQISSAEQNVKTIESIFLENVKTADMASALENMSFSDLVAAVEAGQIQITDNNGKILTATELTPEKLQNIPLLQIKNVQNGKMQEMSGIELTADLFEQPTLGEDFSELLMPTVISEVKASGMNEQKQVDAQKVVKTNSISENIEGVDEPQQVAIETMGEAMFEESLVDSKVKVDLNIKEEKISYLNEKEVVKNSFILQQDLETSELKTEGLNQTVQNNANKPQSAANNQQQSLSSIVNIANSNMNSDDMSITQTISGESTKQILSNGSSAQTVMSGAEFVASQKVDSADKGNQTSFKDVYKGMSKEAVEQVKVNITKSAVKGVDTIEVRLKPEELGHIEIKMQIKDGKLQAHIISSRPETMDILQKDSQVLEKAFNDAGFQTDGNSLSFSFRNEGNQEHHEQLRSFIGKVFEQEANSDIIAAEAVNQNWTAEKGLNIRV